VKHDSIEIKGDCILRRDMAHSKKAMLDKANAILSKIKEENKNKVLVNVRVSDKPLTFKQMTKEKADRLGYLY